MKLPGVELITTLRNHLSPFLESDVILHLMIYVSRFTIFFNRLHSEGVNTHLYPRSLVVVHAGGDPEVDGEGDLGAEAGVPRVEDTAAPTNTRPVGVVTEAGAVRVVGETLQSSPRKIVIILSQWF